MKAKVQFVKADRPHKLRRVGKIKTAIQDLFETEGRSLNEICYVFCSDQYLLDLNIRFLNHDYFTDIISFDLSENLSQITGEIYISTDRVKENAKTHHTTYENELCRVIFHGALHLCGYKDKTKKEQQEMRLKEEWYLQRLQVPRET
jgi:rRNA maturation RNase YbeY